MAPSEVFCDTIVDYDIEQLKKLELKAKYTKIKNGEYDAHEDDETEWDVTDLCKALILFYLILFNPI